MDAAVGEEPVITWGDVDAGEMYLLEDPDVAVEVGPYLVLSTRITRAGDVAGGFLVHLHALLPSGRATEWNGPISAAYPDVPVLWRA